MAIFKVNLGQPDAQLILFLGKRTFGKTGFFKGQNALPVTKPRASQHRPEKNTHTVTIF